MDGESEDRKARLLPPTDVRGALKYWPMASLTPSFSIIKDIPSVKIVHDEFTLCAPGDTEYVDNILHCGLNEANGYVATIANLLNEVDASYLKFKSSCIPPSTFQPENDQILPTAHPLMAKLIMGYCHRDGDAPVPPELYQQQIPSHNNAFRFIHKFKDSKVALVTQGDSLPKHVPDVSKEKKPTPRQEPLRKDVIQNHVKTSPPNKNNKIPPKRQSDYSESKKAISNPAEAAFTRLVDFLDDMFAADDSLTPDTSISEANADAYKFFIPSSISTDNTLLTRETISRVTLLISKAAQYNRLGDVNVEDFSRLLKILERSVRAAEDIDVFAPKLNIDDEELNSEQHQLNFVEEKLVTIQHGLDAAICAFSLMTGGALSRQLYPEDIIISSLNLAKNQLKGTLFTIFELSDIDISDQSLVQNAMKSTTIKRQLNSLILPLTTFFNKLYSLMHIQELSDSVMITVGYFAVAPFFVESSSILPAGLEGIKLAALGLLRSIFTCYPNQRTWILEEILTSLIKLPTNRRNLRQYKLADGKSIQMVSALLLQLIQCCTDRIIRNGFSSDEVEKMAQKEPEEDERNFQKTQAALLEKFGGLCKGGLDAANFNASYIFKYLLSRCTKNKSSNEAEYRALLDNFMEDVLTVLNLPEWPGAELVIRIFSKIMVGYIDDKRAETYTKSMAIDYLGIIAAKIKKSMNSLIPKKEESENFDLGSEPQDIKPRSLLEIPTGEITGDTPLQPIQNLVQYQRTLLDYLEVLATEDPGIECAKQFYLCDWGNIMAANFVQATKASRHDDNTWDPNVIKEFFDVLREFALNGSDRAEKRREKISDRHTILIVTELLGTRQGLYQSFDVLLSKILAALEMSVVAFRTKALKALGQVVVSHPEILSQVNVRHTIGNRLQDLSPAVRDAAIDLVGRYLSQKPEITQQYYKVISERILDTGLNVRKRVIKLLREIYLKSEDHDMMVDISFKFLNRVNDEDSNVKELALKTLQEIWFGPFKCQSSGLFELDELSPDQYQSLMFSKMTVTGKKEVLARTLIMVDVVKMLSASGGESLGVLIQKIIEKSEGKVKRGITTICQCMVDCLIEHLLSVEEDNSKGSVVHCINALYLFSKAAPELLVDHVTVLHPYTKASTSAEDQKILYFVLMIYSNSVPLLKNPDPAFLQGLEQELFTLLSKSSQMVLLVVVPCLCAIVDRLTHNYVRLSKLLRSCSAKLTTEIERVKDGLELSSPRNVVRLLMILGLLCKHFNYDKKRHDIPEAQSDLDSIHKGPILPYMFELIMSFASAKLHSNILIVALQSLGFIYMTQPKLMLAESSRLLMGNIFESNSIELKIQLLKVYLDFLLAEQKNSELLEKEHDKDAPVDIKVLVGNAEELGEAGVSSSLMQCYLDRILDCMLSEQNTLRLLSLDVVSQIIQQGLVHPLKCVPAIVALETGHEKVLREKAYKMHCHLNEKYPSFIHSRNVDAVRTAYDYQKQITKDKPIIGYDIVKIDSKPEALLNSMYTLVKEKRQRRHDFLKSLIKSFDFDLERTTDSAVDPGFCKFVCENLSVLNYKTLEEVLYLIYAINQVLSVTGTNVMHQMELQSRNSDVPDKKFKVYCKVAVCMGLLIILKEYLKGAFSLNEAKCQSFNPSDSGHKDKPAFRQPRAIQPISWDRLMLPTNLSDKNVDLKQTSEKFYELMNESGSVADYHDDAESVDLDDSLEFEATSDTSPTMKPNQRNKLKPVKKALGARNNPPKVKKRSVEESEPTFIMESGWKRPKKY
ncbi:Sister chromatid cohesion protein 2 [Basidiobolus ranarum]|uniref:Sister chromatid cohesion protein n=1 Tax=Basidiobolus ranarum TaxID=34480 RepID=A0ABR2W8Y2_9FUNG